MFFVEVIGNSLECNPTQLKSSLLLLLTSPALRRVQYCQAGQVFVDVYIFFSQWQLVKSSNGGIEPLYVMDFSRDHSEGDSKSTTKDSIAMETWVSITRHNIRSVKIWDLIVGN